MHTCRMWRVFYADVALSAALSCDLVGEMWTLPVWRLRVAVDSGWNNTFLISGTTKAAPLLDESYGNEID